MTNLRTPGSLAELAAQARADIETLDRELDEIDLLVQQAKIEAGRLETKRANLAEKVGTLAGQSRHEPKELVELSAQLFTLTKRTAIMESQVDVLTGKQRVITRYREAVGGYAEALTRFAGSGSGESGTPEGPEPGANAGAPALPAGSGAPGLSRLVLGAQEDLRRDIARAMHDGPAQSLTNIVLQAQIVERLLGRDAAAAKVELGHLVAMVQSTLDATKTFIFDVRPMVLDDLGLVPTLRRATRERSRQARIPVDFELIGADGRLSMELESGLFRMLDEALSAYLAARPDRVRIHLDWADNLTARVVALRDVPEGEPEAEQARPAGRGGNAKGGRGRGRGRNAEPEELPAALVEMIEDRRVAKESAAAAARQAPALSGATWRAIQERATTVGVGATLLEEGSELRLVASLPAA